MRMRRFAVGSRSLRCAAGARASQPPPQPRRRVTRSPHGRRSRRRRSVSIPAKLAQIAAVAKKGHSNCLVVVRDGKLAGEWYFNGTGPNTTQDVYSATKSFASTLVGIAQDDGDLRIGESASKWIPQWQRHAVAGRHGARPAEHGLGPPVEPRDRLPAAARRTRPHGVRDRPRQAAQPGTVWAYNNSAVQTLDRVLQKATGEDVVAFAKQRIFAPLGMAHTTMTTDRAGNAQLFEGIQSTCRDMARFGVLMLDHGRWGEQQIVSASWVEQATARVVDQAQRRLRLPLVAQPQRRHRERDSRPRRLGGRRTPARRRGPHGARARRARCTGRSGSATS